MTTGADKGEIAEVGSPVLLPADPVDVRRPLRWLSVAIAAATLLLALGDAPAVGDWLDGLPPGRWTQPLRRPVDVWMAATVRWHLDAPRAALRQAWQHAKAARFGREQPGEQGTADAP